MTPLPPDQLNHVGSWKRNECPGDMIPPASPALMWIAPLVILLAIPLIAPMAAEAATVVSIGDGDTLRVEEGGKKVTIRLACIDAPEMAQSPYGQQAREALQTLLPVSSRVTLKGQTKDRYGRTDAEMFTQSGANAGLFLVQLGRAIAYGQYLKQCDEWAYLDREKVAERYRVSAWRSAGGIERGWDWRSARRGRQSQQATRPQRPVNLTIINSGPTSGSRSGS